MAAKHQSGQLEHSDATKAVQTRSSDAVWQQGASETVHVAPLPLWTAASSADHAQNICSTADNTGQQHFATAVLAVAAPPVHSRRSRHAVACSAAWTTHAALQLQEAAPANIVPVRPTQGNNVTKHPATMVRSRARRRIACAASSNGTSNATSSGGGGGGGETAAERLARLREAAQRSDDLLAQDGGNSAQRRISALDIHDDASVASAPRCASPCGSVCTSACGGYHGKHRADGRFTRHALARL